MPAAAIPMSTKMLHRFSEALARTTTSSELIRGIIEEKVRRAERVQATGDLRGAGGTDQFRWMQSGSGSRVASEVVVE